MQTTISTELEGEVLGIPVCLDIEIDVDYTPARAAPYCTNPDSPAFSDPGDPGECELLAIYAIHKDGTGKWQRTKLHLSDTEEAEIHGSVELQLDESDDREYDEPEYERDAD